MNCITYKIDETYEEPFILQNESANVIISGTWKSDFPISIRVNTLVVLGGIIAPKLTIYTKSGFFKSGSAEWPKGNAHVCSLGGIFLELDNEALEKIKALGVSL